MAPLVHLPLIRFGEPYASLDRHTISDHRTGKALAELSLANSGLIRRDMLQIRRATDELREMPVSDLIAIGKRAAVLLMTGNLPESVDDYLSTLSAASGLPQTLGRANLEKLRFVLDNLEMVLAGLTRSVALPILDAGTGLQNGVRMGFVPTADALGIVLPNNSPGVNSLWLPALALKTPVVLKPGSTEPFTPYRLFQALAAAGLPKSALLFYGAGHDGGQTIVDACGRAIVFGDKRTADRYSGTPGVSVHGPGYSKIIIGEDQIDAVDDLIEVMADSILRNGGRSCVNASTVIVPRRGREVAEALAARMKMVQPLPMEHPDAKLAAFSTAAQAEGIQGLISHRLETPDAELLTGNRVIQAGGSSFVTPTLVACSDSAHPLAKTEFMFPFASVVEVAQEQVLDWIGPTLVLTAITEDEEFRRALLGCRSIDRLNLGAIPTPQVSWDQPHEGNLFDFLYQRRAVQCR